MAAGNANYDALFSTTLRNYTPKLEENIFTARPLTYWLTTNDRVRTVSGGTKIVEPLIYGTNSTVATYNMYDPLDITPQTGISAAEYNWKQIAASVAIAGLEEAINNGEAAIINLLDAKIMQAQESLSEKFNQMFYTDGTGNSGKDWNGLALLVNDHTGTASVGGIDCTDAGNTWWRSIVLDAASTVRTDARWTNAYNSASRGGNDVPDFALTTQAMYEHYEGGLAANLRFTDNKTADARFQNILFKNIPVMWDVHCPSGTTYFLNSKYLKLVKHAEKWFKNSGFREVPDRDARWAQILCYGQLTTNHRSRHAYVKGQTTS